MPKCFECNGRMEYTGNGNEQLMTAELKCQRCGATFEKCL
jgi:hypothetical protein